MYFPGVLAELTYMNGKIIWNTSNITVDFTLQWSLRSMLQIWLDLALFNSSAMENALAFEYLCLHVSHANIQLRVLVCRQSNDQICVAFLVTGTNGSHTSG